MPTYSMWTKYFNCYRTINLFVKNTKCSFGESEVEYLGHIMGREGVRVDPKKIQAMQYWPRPMTLKRLWGFLGLIGYYRKFVHHYGKISRPLTNLLKKNAFHWTPVTKQAFTYLKQVMCTTPVLAALELQQNICGTIRCFRHWYWSNSHTRQ
jgi:hypothetical protein